MKELFIGGSMLNIFSKEEPKEIQMPEGYFVDCFINGESQGRTLCHNKQHVLSFLAEKLRKQGTFSCQIRPLYTQGSNVVTGRTIEIDVVGDVAKLLGLVGS